MTRLPAQVQGRCFHLLLDPYSREVVGFDAHGTDAAGHLAQPARRTAPAEGMHAMVARPVLQGDDGAGLKATTGPAMLH